MPLNVLAYKGCVTLKGCVAQKRCVAFKGCVTYRGCFAYEGVYMLLKHLRKYEIEKHARRDTLIMHPPCT